MARPTFVVFAAIALLLILLFWRGHGEERSGIDGQPSPHALDQSQ